MNTQTVIWTPLPNGASGENRLQLAVHAAIRLETSDAAATLGDWPAFEHWAAQEISFGVSFGGGEAIPATIASPRRPDLWDSLVNAGTPVRGSSFDGFDDRLVRSYPVRRVMDFLRERYTQIAIASPTDHPPIDDLLDHFGEIGFAGEDQNKSKEQLQAELENELASARAIQFDTPSPPGVKDFLALLRFHRRPFGPSVAPIVPPDFDFHQLLAMCSEHGRLQRLLGVVFDLEVSSRTLLQLPPQTYVQVHPEWAAPAGTTESRPRTRCVVGQNLFRAAPRAVGPELVNGHLPLGGNDFELVQVDPDGAGIKALNFADNLKRSRLAEHNTDDTPESYSVPSLRSGGLSMVRVDRGPRLVQTLDRGVVLNGSLAADPLLDAEDVTRGYLVDVWDAGSEEWHSLTRRQGAYHFTAKPESVPVAGDDEAAVVSAPTSDADPAGPKDLYLQESLFHWNGWSLAAAQPGKFIHRNDTVEHPADQPMLPPPFPLELEFKATPGTLPRLRFGAEYRVRMRAVDIGNNAVPFAQGADESDPALVRGTTYARFEPAQSPTLLLRSPRTEGESVDRIVLRSNYGATAVEAPGERHVTPPRSPQRLAEQHGLFDTAATSTTPSTVDGSAATFMLIANREAKSFKDIGGVVDPDDSPDTLYLPGASFVIPYLPDLLTVGAAFRDLPGATGVVKTYDFSPDPSSDFGGWPNYRPFRLVVIEPPAPNQEGPAAPPLFSSSRVLTVQLPKGDTVKVRLSCTLDPAHLEQLGIWRWLAAAVPAADLAGWQNLVTLGQHWMLTPYRTLTLVHAVRQPLRTPEFSNPSSTRALGNTFAVIRDTMTFSRKSTSKVEVYGAWHDFVDDGVTPPTLPAGPGEPREALAFSVPLLRPGAPTPDDLHLTVQDRHEFHDTKHRDVTYTSIATTAFSEYFLERALETAPVPGTIDLGKELVPGSVTIKDAAGATTYDEGTDFTVNHASGEVTLNGAPGAIPNASPIAISFLATPITRGTANPPDGAGPKTLDIKSSARPASPKVLYIVPTFEWTEGPGTSSHRKGGGLRVYLDRPWWASGAGELLGVLVWAGGNNLPNLPNGLRPYVTQWGIDPLFNAPATPTRYPGIGHFPLSTAAMHGFDKSLDEVEGNPVHVAGHQVGFDQDRELWYCDIEIDAGNAYWPFVRLALARYQPSSIADAHLSRVILADFMQLAPDRSVSVVDVISVGRGAKPRVRVTVSGFSYEKTLAKAGPGTARATLEQRDPDVQTDMGWTPVGNPVPLPSEAGRGGTTLWAGLVTLPSARTPGKFRLVVEQFEELPVGTSILTGKLVTQPRLIYSDIVPL